MRALYFNQPSRELMKIIILSLALATIAFNAYSGVRKEVSILEVGLSMNTNRVFIVTDKASTNSECPGATYAMQLPAPEAYLFYSSALSSLKEDKKMRIQFSETECLDNAPKVEVFWNLK
jgi:hypothetical protein